MVLCLVMVTIAVFGGFALANLIRGQQNPEAGQDVPDISLQGEDPNTVRTGEDTGSEPGTGSGNYSIPVLNRTPVEVIYDVNFETGRIEDILIGILRAIDGKIDYIRIDTDTGYTMSASLYTQLTPDNATLPQMITFSELYRYYHNDKAFDAGRRIISEMLSFNIQFYTAMPDYRFESIFAIEEDTEEVIMEYAVSADEAVGEHGTPGSAKGFIENVLEDSVTNWPVSERLRYLDVIDSLTAEDITFIEAPMYEYNESSRIDTDATGRILYEILY